MKIKGSAGVIGPSWEALARAAGYGEALNVVLNPDKYEVGRIRTAARIILCDKYATEQDRKDAIKALNKAQAETIDKLIESRGNYEQQNDMRRKPTG